MGMTQRNIPAYTYCRAIPFLDNHEWTGDDGKTHRCPVQPWRVCSYGNCDGGERQTDSVDSEDSVAGSKVVGEQVD